MARTPSTRSACGTATPVSRDVAVVGGHYVVDGLLHFGGGGWGTVVITSLVISLCLAIHRHYDEVKARPLYVVRSLVEQNGGLGQGAAAHEGERGDLDLA